MDEIQDEIQFTTVVQDDSLFSASEISEITESPIITSEITETSFTVDYEHIQHNTDGILLMVTGIFFLLVISGISKIVGHFLSM